MPTMNDALDDEIRLLVTELMESAPQAPNLSELDWREDRRTATNPDDIAGKIRARRRPILVGGLGAIGVAAALLLTILWPSGPIWPTSAAAAELQTIASNAAGLDIPSPGPGQWLLVKQKVSIAGHVTQIGKTPTPGAEATVIATLRSWTNTKGNSCVVAKSGPAQFASPANAAAWKAAGMLVDPISQPASCDSVGDNVSTSPTGGGAFDVSRLSTDPSTLAHELITGTTGISGLDQPDGEPNPGFSRAVHLLVGPTSGDTASVMSAIYGALAYIPGVDLIGRTSAHSGAKGIGFSGSTFIGQSVIIVDPSSGKLLEVQNIEAPNSYNGLGDSYVAPPPTPSIGTGGGSAGTIVQWLDPIGSPVVVNSSSLPESAKVNGSLSWLND